MGSHVSHCFQDKRKNDRKVFFLFLHENIHNGYSLEALSEALLMSTQHMFFLEKGEKCQYFLAEKSDLSSAMFKGTFFLQKHICMSGISIELFKTILTRPSIQIFMAN